MDRYARQRVIGGWNQEALSASTILIAGTGWTGFLAAWMATAMGFGRIVLAGRGGCIADAVGLARVVSGPREGWARFLRRVNPDVTLVPGDVEFSRKMLDRLQPDAAIVVDPRRRVLLAARQAAADGLPTVAGWAAGGIGFWGLARPDGLSDKLQGMATTPVLGQIVAALLVEEIRKVLLPLPDEAGPASQRNLITPAAWAGREDRECRYRPGQPDVSVVGAGALGTWFGIAAGVGNLHRRRIHFYDGDEVEETNLNRQVLFFDAVGQPKAPTLAQRLQRLFPRSAFDGYGMLVDTTTHGHVQETDVLAACPDSFAVRGFLNDLARYRSQPLINGGTSPDGGACSTYVPGATPCLNCLLDLDRLIQHEAAPRPCARQAEASVVTSNAIAGALMVWMLQEMLNGHVRRGVWEYDGRGRDVRVGVHS
ncbi:MAG: hypothetical protein HOH74_32250, partial [Gemmatimonadetes bacterium]|nr:hypothetical protein [Gemmatimonadota bacterium]